MRPVEGCLDKCASIHWSCTLDIVSPHLIEYKIAESANTKLWREGGNIKRSVLCRCRQCSFCGNWWQRSTIQITSIEWNKKAKWENKVSLETGSLSRRRSLIKCWEMSFVETLNSPKSVDENKIFSINDHLSFWSQWSRLMLRLSGRRSRKMVKI